MTKGDLDGVMFLRRAVKPVALGLSVAMFILVVVNIANTGRLEDSWLGDLVAVLAGSSFILLMGGWWFNRPRVAEYGLLLACTTYVIRASFLAFMHWPDPAIFFSISTAIIAGGAYLLEAADPRHWGLHTRSTDVDSEVT